LKAQIKISIGELLDRITILELKLHNLQGKTGTESVVDALEDENLLYRRQYQAALEQLSTAVTMHETSNGDRAATAPVTVFQRLMGKLQEVNKMLWTLEEQGRWQIEELGAGSPSGDNVSHVELACTYREVVRQNKRRSVLKSEINQLFNDNYGEVKLYHGNE